MFHLRYQNYENKQTEMKYLSNKQKKQNSEGK